jgi:two-component system OmpR family response regulator
MSRAGAGPLIAVVEDEPLVARTLQQTLREFGYESEWCKSGAELRRLLQQRSPALCIVDLGLPDGDGLELVKQLQGGRRCGVLILTGRGFLTDRVLGLELGADDYMVKPFEPRELIARVRSILRRFTDVAPSAGASRRIARFGGWEFDSATLTLTDNAGKREELSTAEARLLTILLENPNRIMTREQLAGDRNLDAFDRSIDVRMSRLRKHLRDDPGKPALIKTVYGAGYLLTGAVVWSDA